MASTLQSPVTTTQEHQNLGGNPTHQIELVRPVERIRFRRTEYVHVQLFHLFSLGFRSVVRVDLCLGRAGLLGLCLILLSRLRPGRLGGHVACAFYRVGVFAVWGCFALSLAVCGR